MYKESNIVSKEGGLNLREPPWSGVRVPNCSAFLKMKFRGSIASRNNSGESGAPCLKPLAWWIAWPGQPFNKTFEVEVEKREDNQFLHLIPKPKVVRTSSMYCQLTESKAFEMSSLSMIG
jgi:hypothetical protein